ncbi:MAG TPA: DUF1538 domain-containing protein [Pirellulaceae bacterium]|nr:DUF1538 domain-containing protein [Pirellulaceae bacterium]HMO93377.1 DUF1538 domain-containing protein [Pirellulaceae bacterium]HMP70437.1 DUF1538 domain-containing protein [Pirellulaceae bacterium]
MAVTTIFNATSDVATNLSSVAHKHDSVASAIQKLSDLFVGTLASTLRDVLPIIIIILFFQSLVLRQPIANLGRLVWGLIFVLFGLALFLVGLELALFPLGDEMAKSLTSPDVLGLAKGLEPQQALAQLSWTAFYWTYLFAFTIGVSTAFAEPALIAVAMKVEEVSGKSIRAFGLRVAVALGAGIGVSLGAFRIVMGHPLPYYILIAYIIVVVQTWFAPKSIIPLAFDSGGVTTSTVTVPLIAALGLGLATQIPGRSPLIDGFSMIAFACLFPIMTVLGYAQIGELWQKYSNRRNLIKSQHRDDQQEHENERHEKQNNLIVQ